LVSLSRKESEENFIYPRIGRKKVLFFELSYWICLKLLS